MNNDESLIAEAYIKIYHESDNDFTSDDLRAGALDHEGKEAAQKEVNHEDGLKKYTYEILYKDDYKYDPKTKKAISWSYKSHSSGRPDLRHIFAHSEADFWNKIDNAGFGSNKEELRKTIVIKDVQPADLKEVEDEKKHADDMHDNYDNASKTGAYSGD